MSSSARTSKASRAAPTSELGELEDPLWGPTDSQLPARGHPIANDVCVGRADRKGVHFAGGLIDALLLCEGGVFRTAEPDATCFGVAQVRRLLVAPPLCVVHVVFAPLAPRPLLLGLVRLENRGARALGLRYSELWGVEGSDYRSASGACSRETAQGTRALADAGSAVRACPPQTAPRLGLALDLRLVLPPDSRRQLYFAYVAPEPGEGPELLVRAWRGDAASELEHSVASWLEEFRTEPDSIAAYRRRFTMLA